MHYNLLRQCALSAFFSVFALSLSATPIVVPQTLSVGQHYRLIFVTSGFRDATSTDITVYNTFVNDQANLSPTLQALNTTWYAIASTPGTNAIDNIHISPNSAIYNLQGENVAAGEASGQLFSDSLLHPIRYDQSGTSTVASVWTGSATIGLGTYTLGGLISGFGNYAIYGNSQAQDSSWMLDNIADERTSLHFYAISGDLVVTAPEPGTVTLLGAGATLLWALKKRRSAISSTRQ